ncbi:hypothetical protein [Motilibacter deserti]|uniref:Uncharacterized protein n=1 Tax=Motilibacter deserti TaxID=2714956 RepID=A0ABX0GSS4_9ACTN|nr:hypothetical protein [Motilibacter deserti]NHC12781.1 hypothetical protein [Motilibacter deserti]
MNADLDRLARRLERRRRLVLVLERRAQRLQPARAGRSTPPRPEGAPVRRTG